MSYRTEKTHAGMDYLTEMAGDLIHLTKDCENKEEVVKELYWFHKNEKQNEEEVVYNLNDPSHREKMINLLQKFYEEDRTASEKRYEETKKSFAVDKLHLEDYLLVAVYAEKKLTWQDIEYTHKTGFLPAEKRKQPFPLEEMKQELKKKGYTLVEELDEENEEGLVSHTTILPEEVEKKVSHKQIEEDEEGLVSHTTILPEEVNLDNEDVMEK